MNIEAKIIRLSLSILLTVLLIPMLSSCGSGKRVIRAGADDVYNAPSSTNLRKPTTSDPNRARLIDTAYRWLGTPYRYGGHAKDGTDCSGFVMEVYREALNINLPRTSADQHSFCKTIDKNRLQPGDMIFFSSNSNTDKTAHVGMYIGDNRMIHASSSKGVIISGLDENYYVKHFRSAGKVEHPALKSNNTPVVATKRSEQDIKSLPATAASSAATQTHDEDTHSTSKRTRRGLRTDR